MVTDARPRRRPPTPRRRLRPAARAPPPPPAADDATDDDGAENATEDDATGGDDEAVARAAPRMREPGAVAIAKGARAKALHMLVIVHEALNELDTADHEGSTRAPAAARAAAGALREAHTSGRAADARVAEAKGVAVDDSMAALREDARKLATAVRVRLRSSPPGKYEIPIHEVLPGLFVGGWVALNDGARALRKRGVTYVLSVVSQPLRHATPPFLSRTRLRVGDDCVATAEPSHSP